MKKTKTKRKKKMVKQSAKKYVKVEFDQDFFDEMDLLIQPYGQIFGVTKFAIDRDEYVLNEMLRRLKVAGAFKSAVVQVAVSDEKMLKKLQDWLDERSLEKIKNYV